MTRDREPTPNLPGPGDLRPRSAPLLDRAPGERYAPAPAVPPPLERPALVQSLAAGAAGAVAVAIAWLVLGGVLGLDWGMIVAAVAGGWLIGALAGLGAWARQRHVASGRVRLLAVALGVLAWLGGQAVVYLWTRVTLPGSELDLVGRIAATPFADYMGEILGPLDVVELAAMAAVAWLAAR